MMKKKRRKPWDRRKQPYVRALMEILNKHDLSMGTIVGMAIAINWDCQNDPDKRLHWFKSSKLDNCRERYVEIENWLEAKGNSDFVNTVFLEMTELYEYYENQS